MSLITNRLIALLVNAVYVLATIVSLVLAIGGNGV
jgi:hypothetical protein